MPIPDQRYIKLIWRVGRKVGRTIYAQVGDKPTDNDPLIGVFDSRELAQEAVESHNAKLTGKKIH